MRKGLIQFFGAFVLALASFAAVSAQDKVWQQINESSIQARGLTRTVVPQKYATFQLNKTALKQILSVTPMEFTGAGTILTMPMPDGSFARFQIEESPIMERGLADKYPDFKTYRGQGIDDPTATARFDLLPSGFHSMILSANGTVLIDPYAIGETGNYISYFKRDAPRVGNFSCDFDKISKNKSLLAPESFDVENFIPDVPTSDVTFGGTLKTYRLALAATGEYTAAVGGGTVSGALAAQVLIMNRVNGVYERELAVHMNIVANNNLIVYTNGATDPYTNDDGGTMLDENQANLDSVIGAANYDIGHVFSTGGGGIAGVNVPCGTSKANGVTGLPNPIGDAFAIDYVAHEMGHQFGALHTFNGATGSCGGGNRTGTSAYEPGSGITIMGYAGICGNQDLALHSIDSFSVKSLESISTFLNGGLGSSCAVATATGNTPPTVSSVGGTTFNIPKQTPFALTAAATDPNGDSITYDWQEYDRGTAPTTVLNSDADGVARPIFRPYSPTVGGTRFFPSMTYILNNANVPPATYNCGRGAGNNCLVGEILPSIARTMVFQVIARDNRANGGGVNTATTSVVVSAASGPFQVTSPNTAVSVNGGSTQTITWDVANTAAAPINAANVKISLSTDGGTTFPTVLAQSTANDGTENLTIPNVASATARIKIEAVGNIFFDISNVNFTIVQTAPTTRTRFDFDGDGKSDVSIFRPSSGEWWLLRSIDNASRTFTFGAASDKMVPADFTGDGKTDVAFWRPNTGEWFVLRSEDFTYFAAPFGQSGDAPAPADFDADGKADLAVFRPSAGTWFINLSAGGSRIVPFGQTGDVPEANDYDGDGRADIAIFRPSTGEWWLSRSSLGQIVYQFGSSTDKPVPADYTGDGKTDVAFFRPAQGFWYILRSENSTYYGAPFGQAGDVPVPADYDGDGRADLAVFRPSDTNWYLNRSTAGFQQVQFGLANDKPVAAAFIP